MALRTIPVVLSYCELLSQCAPKAVLINFTNPAGLITQAISAQGKVTAVGVCDTPSGVIHGSGEIRGRPRSDSMRLSIRRAESPWVDNVVQGQWH